MASFRFTLTLLIAILVACTSVDTPSTIPDTPTVTPTTVDISTRTAQPQTEMPGPTPTKAPHELLICIDAEPDRLYLYGTAMCISNIVQEAIYDGPNSSFASSDTWNIEEYDYGEGCE